MNLKDKKNTLWRNLPLTAIHVTPTTSFCYELRANQRKETTDPLSVIINSTQYMLLLLQNNTERGDVKMVTESTAMNAQLQLCPRPRTRLLLEYWNW